MKTYDVVIIGGGPAGIFTAWEISKNSSLKVLMVEKGRDISARRCPLSEKQSKCVYCKPCSIVSGWGGAGAFSDGKLTLTTKFGGWLDEYLGEKTLADFIDYVDQIYLSFGATTTVYGIDQDRITEIKRQAAAADLSLVPAKVRHLGTEKCFEILSRMREALDSRVDIITDTAVDKILHSGGKATGVLLDNGQEVMARVVVSTPGREGAEWFANEAERIGLKMSTNPVDIGVRVEVPAPVLSHITDVVYESKFMYYSKSFDDSVRTFCMNPHGEVVVENNGGLLTVNGHSYAEKTTDNTNFALLVSKSFTEPFKEPIAYGKSIARLANMLGGGVIVQRLGDLLSGRRSTPERIKRGLVQPTLTDATPGDLSLVLPYRHVTALIEMLQALDKVAPGVASRHTLLYGVEVKFYSARVELSNNLETQIENLFAGGDGAGVTRGLAQASVAGVVIAREIVARLG